MGLRVNTNIASLTAQRSLSRATGDLNSNFRRLSTGLRISTAADDAAGLAISERLRARIRSLDQASRNAQDGISLVQTAEGSLDEINSMLVRMRELAVQAANGTTAAADQDALDAEFQALVSEIDRTSSQADFNTIKLLDGTAAGPITLQVGAGTTAGTDTLDIAMMDATTATLFASAGAALNIGSTGNQNLAITTLDTAINSVSSMRGDLGAAQNRLDSVISMLQVSSENLSAAESRIRDVDVASESAMLTKNTILQQAAISVLAQANVQPQAALSLLQG